MIQNKNTIHDIRQEFFDAIVSTISEPATAMDKFLNQDKYYVQPDIQAIHQDVSYGDLVIPVKGHFFDQDFELWYSVWHIGDRLKVGIMIKDADLQAALSTDQHKEMNSMWGLGKDCHIDASHDVLLCEWEFVCPDFYTSYMYQEKFVLGVRHMHFRTMKIIYNKMDEMEKTHRMQNDMLPLGIS